MGKFTQGIFGDFTGKVGKIVGSSWRGISYLRSLPRLKKNRQPSNLQLEQQARFALMTAFLNPLRDVLNIGFENKATGATAYNRALSDNLKNAVTGTYPNLAIDYSLVQFSRGLMPGGLNTVAVAAADGRINFSWVNNTGKGKALDTDKVIAMAYCPELDEADYSINEATREDEALSLIMPTYFNGKVVETYIFWISENGKNRSATTYTGSVMVLD